ncbi:MAG: S1 RNA-binding domain-containing protein [Chloroflexota bacterium]
MNIHNSDKKKYQNSMPQTDEGWWESVLAEEQQYASARPQVATAKPKPMTPEEKTISPPEVHQADWDLVRRLYSEDCIIDMQVTGHNRGGVLVEHAGLAGFVPFSHLVELAGKTETDRNICLEAYAGKTLSVKVIECAPEDGRVVFSERAALTQPGKRNELFHSLQMGAHVTGKVTNITDFGVFVDLGGVEGLIHISELSWGRVSHPNQIVRLGEEIKVQVLEISLERSRVALSLKRLISNPWEHAETSFAVGNIIPAVVTAILSYGAFARLDMGVEGLIHASEMMLQEHQVPRDILIEGQQVQVRVIQVEPAHQRLGLSMRLNHE